MENLSRFGKMISIYISTLPATPLPDTQIMDSLITDYCVLMLIIGFITGFITMGLIVSFTGWIVHPNEKKTHELNQKLREYFDED